VVGDIIVEDDDNDLRRTDTGEYEEVVDLPRQIYQNNNQPGYASNDGRHKKALSKDTSRVLSQSSQGPPAQSNQHASEDSHLTSKLDSHEAPRPLTGKEQLEQSIYEEYRVCDDHGDALEASTPDKLQGKMQNHGPAQKIAGQSRFQNQMSLMNKSVQSSTVFQNFGGSDQISNKTIHPNFFGKSNQNNLSDGPQSNFSKIRKMAAK